MGKAFVRTRSASHNPIVWDNGRGTIEFFKPGGKWLGRASGPADNRWHDGSHSFMAPPMHYHLLQSETFEVESGSGYWILGDVRKQLHAGQRITIPAWTAHRFEAADNAAKEPLTILWGYDASRRDMEERFFRNTLPYFDDCRRAGMEPSVLQLSVFCAAAWMPVDVIPVPGGHYIRCFVNTLLLWVLAAVGYVFCGYRASYPEYYDRAVSAKMWADDAE